MKINYAKLIRLILKTKLDVNESMMTAASADHSRHIQLNKNVIPQLRENSHKR